MRNKILATVKKVIKEYIHHAGFGIFFTENTVGDHMETLYDDGNIKIDICYDWGYFEVLGLTDDEQEVIDSYYYRIRRR